MSIIPASRVQGDPCSNNTSLHLQAPIEQASSKPLPTWSKPTAAIGSKVSLLDSGGAFAGVILVFVSDEGFNALDQAVQTSGNTDLSIHLTRATAEPHIEPNLRLTLTGPDRPGIVYEITHELAELQINILHFSSHVQSGAWSGEALFIADLETRTPAELDLDELRDRLDAVEEKMTLEIDIESDSA